MLKYMLAPLYGNGCKHQSLKLVGAFEIEPEDMFWTRGTMLSYSVTIDVWAEVPIETATLLKLAGLCT
jgi:hypothetical protein